MRRKLQDITRGLVRGPACFVSPLCLMLVARCLSTLVNPRIFIVSTSCGYVLFPRALALLLAVLLFGTSPTGTALSLIAATAVEVEVSSDDAEKQRGRQQYTESDRVRTLYEKYIELDSESDRVRTLYEKYIELDSEFDRVRTLYEKYIEFNPTVRSVYQVCQIGNTTRGLQPSTLPTPYIYNYKRLLVIDYFCEIMELGVLLFIHIE
ncbi:hypothetical protein H4582DRAFT_2054762 [Lactarius indigo]|nr:hypothetical protein H4582DRAFT_2054762 [Lactarius indigo]